MLKYFLDKKPWKFVVFITITGTLFSVIFAGVVTWIVYHEISWFIEILAGLIPLMASPILSLPTILFIKNYQREKENQRSILEIIHNIDDIFFLADEEGKLMFVNNTMQKKLGFSEPELLGKDLLSIHPEVEQVKISESIGKLYKDKQYSCRTYLKRKDNTTIPVETSAKILKWDDASVVVCISRDISKQQKIMNRLRDSEIRFREFAEMLPELVCEADENGVITFVNKNAVKRFGYTQEEILGGVNVLEFVVPEERVKAIQFIEERMQGDGGTLQEFTALKKDGTTFPCFVILSPIYENARQKGFRGLMIDITKQKNEEVKLVATLDFVRNLVENLPLGILIFNSSRVCVSSNRKALKILGVKQEELIDKKLEVLDKPFIKLSEIVGACTTKKVLINKKVEIEFEFEDENIWLDCTALPNKSDNSQNVILIINDITQQVEYEQELKNLNLEVSTQNMSYLAQNREIRRINELIKENQKNLKQKTSELELLINNIKIQIWYLKTPYEYGIVNQAHAEFLGKTIEEISYRPVAEVLPSNELGDAITNSLNVYKTKSSLFKELWTLNGKGEKRLLSMMFSPSINDEGNVDFVICSATDVTLERLAEEKIKKNLLQQEYISNISNMFNSLEENEIVIHKAITLMGTITRSSRVYVFENIENKFITFKLYEWLEKGGVSHVIKRDEKASADYEFLRDSITGKGSILSNNITTFENGLKEYYKERNVVSVMAFPILVNDRFYGIIGIDECKEIRTWEKLEVELLKIVSNLLGNYLAKKEILEKLKLSEQSTLEAKDAAEKANALKSEFLANMSHEIRTPMNAILGYAKLLSKKIVDENQKEHIEIIRESGKNLLALINDILDLSKIEAGKMRIENRPLSPRKIIDEIQNIFKLKAKEKGIQFITEVDPNLPEAIVLDEIRLRQVLFNLVGNAIKFTQKGYVKLSALGTSLDRDNNKINLSFTVEDTGIGIAEDQVNEIFKSFKQQDGQSSKFEGTGLGLTITRKLVDMMDGFVTVSSKLGKGSQFTVELFEVATSSPIEEIEEITERSIDFLQAKILLVEDNPHNQALVKYFLEDNNVLLYTANNGKEAIKSLESIIPDVILMDIKMPVMDGYEATKIIKSKPEWAHIPIVPMSAHILPEEKIRMRHVGTTGFIPKPIDDEVLCKELAKFLKHKRRGHKTINKENDLEFNIAPDLEKLSSDRREFLLDNIKNELEELWLENSKLMQIHRWRDFGEKVIKIGSKHESDVLISYGKEFIGSADSFNIKKLKALINLYEKIQLTIENFK